MYQVTDRGEWEADEYRLYTGLVPDLYVYGRWNGWNGAVSDFNPGVSL